MTLDALRILNRFLIRNNTDKNCCGNCINYIARDCKHPSMAAPPAVCQYHTFDGLTEAKRLQEVEFETRKNI